MDSPFEGMSKEEVRAAYSVFGQEMRRQFDQKLDELSKLLLSLPPVPLLANLSTYHLFHTKDVDPEVEGVPSLLQFHIEFVQSLVLMHEESQYRWAPSVPPGDFERVCQLTREVFDASAFGQFSKISGLTTDRDFAKLRAQESIRLHTIAVRNWGFPDQMFRILHDLWQPLDSAFSLVHGVTATALLQLLRNLVELTEQRANDMVDRLRPMYRGTTVPEIVRAYSAAFPEMNDDVEPTISLLQQRQATPQEARVMLLLHNEIRYPDLYTLTMSDLVDSYPEDVEPSNLLAVVAEWSYRFGELKARNPFDFMAHNPVWTRPLIKRDQDVFVCPIPGLLHSFASSLMEELVVGHSRLSATYEERRGKFLETQIEDLFRRYFPSAQVYAGSMWKDPGTEGENDLLVVLDEYAIIVEAKAGKVTLPAQRGLPLRLESTLKKLVVESSEQGRRFGNMLEQSPGVHKFETKSGHVNVVETSRVRHFLYFNVTLELFGILALRANALKEAGFIPDDLDMSPTMCLADLEIQFDLLDSEVRRLHYLKTRFDFESYENLEGDELDLLAFYLDGCPGLETLGSDEKFGGIFTHGMSKAIDPYYGKEPGDRPEEWRGTQLRRQWSRLISDVVGAPSPGWLDVTLSILDATTDQQRRVERSIDELSRKVRRSKAVPAYRIGVFEIGRLKESRLMAAVVYLAADESTISSATVEALAICARENPERMPLLVHIDASRPYRIAFSKFDTSLWKAAISART